MTKSTKTCPDCKAEVFSVPNRMGTTPEMQKMYDEFRGERKATADDLVERLRSPMWVHSPAAFDSPQLEQEETLTAMRDAADLICWLSAQPAALRAQPASPLDSPISAIHTALAAADLEYSGYSCNGVNLVGDKASIKAAGSAFHSHSQIDQLKTQIRHWREECGKLHARSASPPEQPAADKELL